MTVLYAAVFTAVGVALLVRARTTGQQASQRLGWWMFSIALIAAGTALGGENTFEDRVATDVLLLGFGVYPLFLLQFGASLRAGSRRLGRTTLAVLVTEAIGSAVILAAVTPREVALGVLFGLFTSCAVVAHVLVQSVLLRQIRRMASSFFRRRAMVLSAGMLVLATSLGVGVLVPGEVTTLVGVVGGGIAATLLAAGAAPPQWLLHAFLQPDRDQLVAAEDALITAPDVTRAVEALLRALLRLYSGRAAWLRRDGELVAAVGGGPDDFSAPRGGRGRDSSIQQVLDGDGDTLWLLRGVRGTCELEIVAGDDPVLYGLDVAELLPRTARRVDVALEGRRLEQRLLAQQRAEQEAEHYRRVADLKDDLLSTINHELRTMLQTVAGGLELVTVRWDGLGDGQRRLLVTRADHNARAMARVVAEILALAEMRTGVTTPSPRASALREVLDAAVVTDGCGGRVEAVCPDVEVVLDPDLVAQVLRQLTDNALEHTDGPVRVELAVDDGDLRLCVHDTGPGVPQELLAPFERGGHYLHRTTRGFGLGLTLVTETLQLLGGELALSHDGNGTTATCRVPHGGVVRGAVHAAGAISD